MATKKQKEKKKKERERIAHARVLARREFKRKKDKAEREAWIVAKRTEPKMEPIMSEEKKKARVQEQLERNMKILEALEAEYEKEKQARKDLNDELEEQGFETVEEKVKEIQRRIGDDKNQLNILTGQGQANFGYDPSGGVGGPQ